MRLEGSTVEEVLEAVRALAARERERCLWFMREGEIVSDVPSALEVLRQIGIHGDLEAYRHAEALRRDLLRASGAAEG
jgi:hypothetical protein